MARVYFINAFMEVDMIPDSVEQTEELRRVGNLFTNEETALAKLQEIKKILKAK